EARVLRLFTRALNRYAEPPTAGELIDQRLRNLPRGARDQDDVVWGGRRPAEASIGKHDLDAFETQSLQVGRGALRESRLALDGDHAATEPAEHGRLIARAGADLEC